MDTLSSCPQVFGKTRLAGLESIGAYADRLEAGPRVVHRLIQEAVSALDPLQLLADYYLVRGEPQVSAAYLDRVTPRDDDLSMRCAEAYLSAGEPEAALERVRAVVPCHRARRVIAEALDVLGRFDEATDVWAELTSADSPLSDRLDDGAARTRGLRRRGRLSEAERLAEALLATADDFAEAKVIQMIRLELARIQLARDAQKAARITAAQVVEYFTRHGLTGHHQLFEAQEVLAEAILTPQLDELRSSTAAVEDAVESLGDLRAKSRRTHGPSSARTLTTTVAYAHALIGHGRPEQAREELEAVRDHLTHRLGLRHPVYLRAVFLQGQAEAQLHNDAAALGLYRVAYVGQRAVLGSGHPDTLRTGQELAVTLKLTGHTEEAVELFTTVRRATVDSVGRKTDLYMQAMTGSVLSRLPSWMWRMGRRSR